MEFNDIAVRLALRAFIIRGTLYQCGSSETKAPHEAVQRAVVLWAPLTSTTIWRSGFRQEAQDWYSKSLKLLKRNGQFCQVNLAFSRTAQLTHNVVTKLLERCSLVRSDLTFRRRSHDVHRSFGLSQRCHNVVWTSRVQRYFPVPIQRCHNVVWTSRVQRYVRCRYNVVTTLHERRECNVMSGADTTLSQRCMNVASATLCPVPTQRCHNVAWTSRVQRYVLVLTQCCHNVVWTAL